MSLALGGHAFAGEKKPAGGGERVKIAVIPLKAKGAGEVLASNITDILTLDISKHKNFDPISQEDVKAILAMNKQQIDMGCENNVVCVAEVGGAMGASKVLSGTLGMVGEEYILNIQIIDIENVKIEGRAGEKAADEKELMEKAAVCIDRLLGGGETSNVKKKKPILAILGLEIKGGVPTEASSIFSDRVRDEIIKLGGYDIIDRANMKTILESQGEQLKDCYSQECALEVGKLVVANKIVTGSLSKMDDKYYLSINMTDVETGRIERVSSAECACKITEFTGQIGSAVAELMGKQAKKAAQVVVKAPVVNPATPPPVVNEQKKEKVADVKGPSRRPGWALLGVAVAAGGGSGFSYLNATAADKKYRETDTYTGLDKYKKETEQNLLTSRILAGVSIAAAGASLYLLLRDESEDKEKKTAENSAPSLARLDFGPGSDRGSYFLSGAFKF